MGIEVLVKIGMDFYYFKSGLNYQNETLFVAEYDWKHWHLHGSKVFKGQKREF